MERAQNGNICMSKAKKAMRLDLNLEKSATILFGKRNHILKVRKSIEENQSLSQQVRKLSTYPSKVPPWGP